MSAILDCYSIEASIIHTQTEFFVACPVRLFDKEARCPKGRRTNPLSMLSLSHCFSTVSSSTVRLYTLPVDGTAPGCRSMVQSKSRWGGRASALTFENTSLKSDTSVGSVSSALSGEASINGYTSFVMDEADLKTSSPSSSNWTYPGITMVSGFLAW